MTEQDFKEWKSHPITITFFKSLAERIYDLQVDLGASAGLDPREDGRKVGAIQAYVDLLNVEYEETQTK